MVRVAVYPGTFDPFTNGHLGVLLRAIKLFDKIIVAVASDTEKRLLFSMEKRIAMVESAIAPCYKMNVEVLALPPKILVNFAHEHNVVAIVRGVRSSIDLEYEFRMAHINSVLNKDIITVFLPSTSDSNFVSSSTVKEIAKFNGKLDPFVSKEVEDALRKAYQK
ncbi:pantetheine-phosphate adenylyltransferase [Candidatus Fokinia crypta]|uniref:Phosphopantetheine adenylyltransferase n=1 Tax=Candidatus Fokinia crypta TaxID=1920990 RepID=A0ABZ0UNR9_9RICK|nr:pantetheine-phosphate adenylyltransferase [Candidatus Fokinia cryptica]WPX97764.1 Phosphopantetheine adenylyltransferase [Candidatus Fokinia cryptica]